MAKKPSDRPGIQSVEVAATILKAMTETRGAVSLKDLAAAADMAPAKTHRYLVSLARTGLVEQDQLSGRYAIGPLSLALGLAALGGIDVVRVATAAMPALRDAIDETVVLAVWGSQGPTVIRFEESSHPVTVNVRVGNILPLLTTALGKVYAAYLHTQQVRRAIDSERRVAGKGILTRKDVDAMVEEVRARGLARIAGDLLPGVSAMAAPIFDHQGQVVAALGVIGREAQFDTGWNGPIATALRGSAAAVSHQLGHGG